MSQTSSRAQRRHDTSRVVARQRKISAAHGIHVAEPGYFKKVHASNDDQIHTSTRHGGLKPAPSHQEVRQISAARDSLRHLNEELEQSLPFDRY